MKAALFAASRPRHSGKRPQRLHHPQVVEAIEMQGHRWGLGVQWNPEDGDDPRLFEALVTVAKSVAAQAAAQPQPEVTARSKRSAKRHAARSS